MALPYPTKSRTWDLGTSANGTFFDTEFNQLYANDAYLLTQCGVNSVFSRTGAVTAEAGDYAAHYAPIKPQCEWRADTHAGYGSTDTKIPYFTNVRVNVDTASAITVTNNSTNGCMVLINTADYYTFSYNASPASPSYIGFSLNSAQLTTGVDGINVQNRLALTYIIGTETARVSIRLWCAVNDVVRVHTSGIAADTAAFSNFSVTRG